MSMEILLSATINVYLTTIYISLLYSYQICRLLIRGTFASFFNTRLQLTSTTRPVDRYAALPCRQSLLLASSLMNDRHLITE